ARVVLAQVVRVRLGEGGQRPDHGGRVGVDIGQRRDRRPGATVTGTAPWGPHGGTLSPPAHRPVLLRARYAELVPPARRTGRRAARRPGGGLVLRRGKS